jgi:hypothetical protein
MTHTNYTTKAGTAVMALASLFALAAMLLPVGASAATYAYVATNGEVKSIVASDWMKAIATAPGIHINSGVLLLNSAADYEVIGDDVPSV